MPLLRFPRASILLHPAMLASLIWCLVSALYSLHLSALLIFSDTDVIRTSLIILLPIVGSSGLYSFLFVTSEMRGLAGWRQLNWEVDRVVLEHRIRIGMRLWIAAAAVETAVSGGVPLVWLIAGSPKTDFDYGIASIHGMVDALLLALAATSVALYLYTGEKRHLRIPALAILWSFVIVSRGGIFVLLLESAILYLRLRGIRAKVFIFVLPVALCFILGFGWLGDFRNGAEAFRALAQPTGNYPDAAPSGLLWFYIYVTTPINNLMYSMHIIRPTYNLLLPNTLSTLFPSVLRTMIFGAQADTAVSGALVSSGLNVSTAYVGPFQDMGVFGMIGFSAGIGLLCARYWHRTGFWNVFLSAVFTGALMLSLFYNEFCSLPILGQLVWFYYFSNKRMGWSRESPS